MTAHISDELPRMLTGEASREVVQQAAAHLRECPDCQQELVSAVVAHAALSSAQRYAPEVMTRQTPNTGDDEQTGLSLPDLTAMFAQVREESATESTTRYRRRAWLAAAAAVVLVGGGVGLGVGLSDSGSSGTTVALGPTSPNGPSATATVANGGHMQIDATSLPQLDAGNQYEVWLTSGAHHQSIGFIGDNRRADLTVPTRVMANYTGIAVSLQKNGQTRFSGDTVVYGSYT